MGIKSAFRDFRNGLSILFSRPKDGEGDRGLAKVSGIVEGMIPSYGKNAVRTQVIKSIESDLKKAAKKGPDEVEAQVQRAIQTPEYMRLLKRLGMGEPEVRVLAMEALKRAK